jgi:hemerythrin-like domain-containing protein
MKGGRYMTPMDPLVEEHRLIEGMIDVCGKRLKDMRSSGAMDPLFVAKAVDFIRFYADRTHHGKEEDLLFRELESRDLEDGDRALMEDLVKEHVMARETTARLERAGEAYVQGDETAVEAACKELSALVNFYPIHIEKEDMVFFPSCLKYFNLEEQAALVDRYWEFDRQLVHEKYARVVEDLAG